MNLHDDENKHSCCKNEGADSTGIKDPVCGMGVNENDTFLRYEYKGLNYYFCSEHCMKAFKNNPEDYLAGPDTKPAMTNSHDNDLKRIETQATELRDAKEKLRLERDFLQTTIDSLPYPFYVVDMKSHSILIANKVTESVFGREGLIGAKCYKVSHHRDTPCDGEEHPCPILAVKRTGKPFITEHIHFDKNNNPLIMEVHGYPVYSELGNHLMMIEFSIDITEKKELKAEKERLEGRLRQAQKMEAIGTLAGGIAHDFNNILAAIMGYADMAHEKAKPDSSICSDLEQVLKAVNRAKELVKQILCFSRQGEIEKKPIQIQTVIKEALKLLRASLPTTIEIRQNIDTQCGPITADPTQIHQVLMNLCTNAAHAMRDQTDGVLSVALQEVTLDSADLRSHPDIVPGAYIKLTIGDTGHGMEQAICERIFEPYFTTKEKGKGTGLGLSVAHGIIKNHDGDITVYSELGKGTTFNIYLPRIVAEHGDEEPCVSEPIKGGTEHILFVEDEEIVAQMGEAMLTSLGYKVTALKSSIEALAHFKAQPDKFDLVITDMTMRRMTGKDLSENILNIRPETPIILCTGFSELINGNKAKQIGIRAYFMKPILKRDLAKIVRKVLDEK